MPKPNLNLLFLFLLCSISLYSQPEPDMKTDPLGRPYRPVVGLLEPIAHSSVPKQVARRLAESFYEGAADNPRAAFGVVQKTNLGSTVKFYAQLDSAEQRKARQGWFYGESTGAEYLLQIDVPHFGSASSPAGSPANARLYNFYADLTARLTDVSTSKVLAVEHFNLKTGLNAPTMSIVPDSARMLEQLYLNPEIRGEAMRMLSREITATALVSKIEEDEKGKAETVILQNSPIPIGAKYEVLAVYAVLDTFKTASGTFLHAEQMATIAKTDEFDPYKRNYKVRRGAKDLAEQFRAGKRLVVCKGSGMPLRRAVPNDGRRNILAEAFANKTTAPDYQARVLENMLTASISKYPQLINIVDREMYALIEAERKMQAINQSDATQGGATAGAEYLLAADVTQLDFHHDVIRKAKQPPPANADGSKIQFADNVNAGIRVTANVVVDIRLVNIQTGEIVWNKTIKCGALKDFLYGQGPSAPAAQDEEVTQLLADNFALSAGPVIYRKLRPATPILKVEDEGKTVLIGGGEQAGNIVGQYFELLEITEELVDGKPLRRETVVGKLRSTDVYPETSRCKVQKGEDELAGRFKANPTGLYCRLFADYADK